MQTYKTPGVYVQEISLFPPSVAEVETAIPAFIGYVETATNILTDDLLNTPTKLKSLLEFEELFGGAPEIVLNEVQLDDANTFVSADYDNSYYLYDSLRSFFDNGGGDCYVVAVGEYGDPVEPDDFLTGLAAIAKVDEPTILVFPDAAGMTASQLGGVQQQALAQCGRLGDRVAVLDTTRDDVLGATFRDNIGINNLKYGAAYTPWLRVQYPKNVSYEDISTVLFRGATQLDLATMTSDTAILSTLSSLDDAIADREKVADAVTALLGSVTPADSATISEHFNRLVTAYRSQRTPANMQAIYGFVFRLATLADDLLAAGTGVASQSLRDTITGAITNTLRPTFSKMISNEKELDSVLPADDYEVTWDAGTDPADASWGGIFSANDPDPSAIYGALTTDLQRTDAALAQINADFARIAPAISSIVSASEELPRIHEARLLDTFPIYRNILTGINNSLSEIPPSGTIAGVYATVDNARGVWKAPANVSLANVIAPAYAVDATETDDLNVDTNAGKSINAIRFFSGKGTLVWGARTLAGNDNEWRYVSVRRFFNMVEESVKKSTYWAVFESNDANTWVKVRGMIENYLTQKWREGALAGATTKDAFFVKCGLGTTMSAVDILEGRMNVEIGMAVVRPAEFIILKFSHKLQLS